MSQHIKLVDLRARASRLAVGHCTAKPKQGRARKLGYATYAKARKAATLLASRGAGGRMAPYECPNCGHWHLSSQRRASQ